jgi:hypothetical protein
MFWWLDAQHIVFWFICAKMHQPAVHRTVSGAQAGPTTNSSLSWKKPRALRLKGRVHRTVRWAYSARANGRQRDQRVARGPSQRSPGRTGLSGEPRGLRAQRSASPEKERNRTLFMSGGAPDCPVRQPTEGKYCLPNGDPTAPSYLGAIKETPRRMEHNTKPPLNILRCLDSANTHSDHRDLELSTLWAINLLRYSCVLSSWLVCVGLVWL